MTILSWRLTSFLAPNITSPRFLHTLALKRQESGRNCPKRALAFGETTILLSWDENSESRLCIYASPMGIWEFSFYIIFMIGTNLFEIFCFSFYQPQLSLSNSISCLKTINKMPFSFSSAAYKPILFIAINLAPFIYKFRDLTVSFNHIKKMFWCLQE